MRSGLAGGLACPPKRLQCCGEDAVERFNVHRFLATRIAIAVTRVGNDGCTRACLKHLTIKPNLCDLYDIDPAVERARFAPLRVGEQTCLVPMSSGRIYHGCVHRAVVIAG